jgi:hypothetical protein
MGIPLLLLLPVGLMQHIFPPGRQGNDGDQQPEPPKGCRNYLAHCFSSQRVISPASFAKYIAGLREMALT